MTIFRNISWSWVWTVVRVYLGYQWLEAGLNKAANPKWAATGEALQAYWVRAASVPAAPAKPPISYDWYRAFIQGLVDSGSHAWFAKLVAYGEVLVGIALILGVATMVAAAAGALMNMNFMLAGSASTNPVLYTLAILLLVAGANAYYWGADRWLMPWLMPRLRSRLRAYRAAPAGKSG